MATNAIAGFEFLSLEGHVADLKQELELVARPGVPGTGVWRTGKRGRPFTLASEVDCIDHVHARQLYHDYRGIIGIGVATLVWQGYHMTSDGFGVVVLDVRIVPGGIFKLLNATPGLNPPSLGYLVCQWDLLPVAI